jgi:hypothetical protein
MRGRGCRRISCAATAVCDKAKCACYDRAGVGEKYDLEPQSVDSCGCFGNIRHAPAQSLGGCGGFLRRGVQECCFVIIQAALGKLLEAALALVSAFKRRCTVLVPRATSLRTASCGSMRARRCQIARNFFACACKWRRLRYETAVKYALHSVRGNMSLPTGLRLPPVQQQPACSGRP